ncbi:MAG TPA: hypothetical protein VNW26_10235 [Steroidobacteraceae bacterium]|jgi:hypothetical protein|nr:hypothetical protein [Steroidobacteraceae bacterium]
MKFVPSPLPLNCRWLTLGAAIALGTISTGLNHESPQLEAQVRAAYRMISVLVAKKDSALTAQVPPEVSSHDSPAKCARTLPVNPRDMPLVT